MPNLEYTSKAKLLFTVKNLTKKELRRSKTEKPYSRTTAYNRNQGWMRKVHRHYLKTSRVSVYKKALRWFIARQPIT